MTSGVRGRVNDNSQQPYNYNVIWPPLRPTLWHLYKNVRVVLPSRIRLAAASAAASGE